MLVINHLIEAINSAAVYNRSVQSPPDCVLWPDSARQWESVIPELRSHLPELYALGPYNPDAGSGPAIWLRCALSGALDDPKPKPESVPVLYLPGYSRQDLRNVESCTAELQPLAELQFRGAIWSQRNSRDWTILAYLKSLGLDISPDKNTAESLKSCLSLLLHRDVETLKRKRLDEDFFNELLSSGDLIRDLLNWLNDSEKFKSSLAEVQWKAFQKNCKSKLDFQPAKQGALTGACLLAEHAAPWDKVWDRFCEAPSLYTKIPDLIRKTEPKSDLFVDVSGWPQCNDQDETHLRNELLKTAQLTPNECRSKILELEKQNSHRREWLWAKLGQSPLAMALEWLAVIAGITSSPISGSKLDDLVSAYSTTGWKADDALLRSMSCVDKKNDVEAVSRAINAMYIQWAEESARILQEYFYKNPYPFTKSAIAKKSVPSAGTCVCFVDGLRFDLAKRLIHILTSSGFNVRERTVWSALPSVTATAKPAVSPVAQYLAGVHGASDFEPVVEASGQSLKGGYQFEKLLSQNGWDVLDKTDVGNPESKAWAEFGNIDHEGHDKGSRISKSIDSHLGDISENVKMLFEAGWKKIRLVTDHGWLLLPGGLPKIELSPWLVENKWGRCAIVKEGAHPDQKMFQWFWNPDIMVALPAGIGCFKNGMEYAHGGLSYQECLTLELTVSRQDMSKQSDLTRITNLVWKGLRLNIEVQGDCTGLKADIREHPGDPDSSKALAPKTFKSDGTVSIVVDDEDLEGQEATVVVINDKDQIMAQYLTIIGRGSK